MDSLDFQIEDMYIVERQQQALNSPRFGVGPLAHRVATPLTFFQANVLDFGPRDGNRRAAE